MRQCVCQLCACVCITVCHEVCLCVYYSESACVDHDVCQSQHLCVIVCVQCVCPCHLLTRVLSSPTPHPRASPGFQSSQGLEPNMYHEGTQ